MESRINVSGRDHAFPEDVNFFLFGIDLVRAAML
ncbi:hypothetical protein X741_26060 [Mesorhizobium sp. LNHC229A00]|nr:hypothetical protein X741_26060 [Mesorhizobium sp. LNHC229A00]